MMTILVVALVVILFVLVFLFTYQTGKMNKTYDNLIEDLIANIDKSNSNNDNNIK